jgi:TolA-binding protein
MMFLTVSRYLFFLLLGLTFLPAHGHTQAQPDCTTALQDYQVALQSYQDGLLDSAIAGFEAYLQKCPETARAAQVHYLLGEILYKRQRFTDALRHVTYVISSQEQTTLYPYALLLAAQCARQLEQLKQAEAYLQKVLAFDGSDDAEEVLPAALYWLGELAFQQQHYEAARVYYHRVIATQRTGTYAAYAQYALGWLYRQLGNAPEALKAFSAFLTMAPDHEFALQARFAQAALLRDTKQLAEALKAFQRLAREAPADMQDEALFWWAETAYQLGRYAEASSTYQRLLSKYPQSVRAQASLYGWGWAEMQQRHCAEAVRPWERLLRQAPQFPRVLEIHYQLGVCYLQLKQNALAQRHLQQVVKAKTPTARRQDALLKLATLAFQAEAFPEAIRYSILALATASPADRLRLHYLLGESYAVLGKSIQAIRHWQQVLTGPPSLRAQALFRIGSAYMAQHEWVQAIKVLHRLWDNFPEFTDRMTVATYLVQAYRKTQRCAEALPFYDAIIDAATGFRQQQASVGAKALCLLEAGQYADVVQLLTPFLAPAVRQTVEPQVLYMLGQANIQLQHYQEAVEPFSLLRQRFPDHPLTATAEPLLARALEHVGRYGEALAVWKASLRRGTIKEGKDLTMMYLHVGRLAFKEGQFVDALDFLAPVREASIPALAAEALFWSGEVYLQQQQWDLALQVYQELIDRYAIEQQWSTLARLRLGVIYEHQQEWERALQAYRTLLTTTTDEEVLANARQRIAAIEAGHVLKSQPLPASSSEG